MSLDREEQALLLLTNRLLLDWFSISVDTGLIDKGSAERLIDFSAKEVAKGAPWLSHDTQTLAEIIKSRLPAGRDKD
jgi:hypothetical protein